MNREYLPNRRGSELFEFTHNGFSYTATISKFSDGRLAEIFIDSKRPNSEIAAHASDAAVLCSLLLQHGISVAAIRHSISGPLSTALALAEAEGST
jgi:ribonucleoside-diphosphate reductase alpha chain